MEFSKLERDVLDAFLDENDERYPQLRSQVAVASVKSRDFTSHGFFTKLELPLDSQRIPRDSRFFIALVCAVFEGGAALGFALFVEDGRLETIEGFTYERGWPRQDICDYKLSYHRSTGKVIALDYATQIVH